MSDSSATSSTKLADDYTDYKLFDAGVNIWHPMYKGEYNGKKVHQIDRQAVLERAKKAGVNKFLFTPTNYNQMLISKELAHKSPDYHYTIGVHPEQAKEVFTHLYEQMAEDPNHKTLRDMLIYTYEEDI